MTATPDNPINVLITGAAGQAGVALVAAAPPWAAVSAVTRRELDITDADAVTAHVRDVAPAVIINAAAYTDVEGAESDRDGAFAVNAQGADNVARAAAATGARLVHFSTDYVFAGDSASPLAPDHPVQPINVYGASKLDGERRVQQLGDAALIVRTSWLYHASGHNFVKTMLRLMNERDTLSVVADQVGAPTSADTLAHMIWTAVDRELSGVHHWQDAGVASWYDFAVAIDEIGRQKGLVSTPTAIAPVSTAEFPSKVARPAYSVLDTSSTHAALDLPYTHWRTALEATLESLANANS
ncbi:MAG: dTDP-4-dehydrorhamnose reductase [Pseudomonadota bacterium]